MTDSRFVYVIFIRSTPEKIWEALTAPEFTRQTWVGTTHDCAWRPGAAWKLVKPDGEVADSGEVIEIDPPRKLVLRWRNEFRPELREEGYSRMTWTLEPQADTVKVTVVHEMERPGSKFIQAVSNGWPIILSSVKSLLETGESLEATHKWLKSR